MNGIIRVFPRRTKATPDDDLAFVGEPGLFPAEASEVHISCTFTWDRREAERLYCAWKRFYRHVHVGGPAYDSTGGDFVSGRYLKTGYVITTRGCPNRCDFCFVPGREGNLRCLPITDGWDLLDNNLLAAPEEHIRAVLEMLRRQPKPARFTGGLEARRVADWFVNELAGMRVHRLFLAYDRASEKGPVLDAIGKFKEAGFSRSKLCCYVLVGCRDDTQIKAEERCDTVLKAGATPFAMYYRDADAPKQIDPDWRAFVRQWTRPAAMFARKAEA